MLARIARFGVVLRIVGVGVAVGAVTGCETPHTKVVVVNDYPVDENSGNKVVVYRAFWQAVSFDTPIEPGASSAPVATVSASANTAYALLAPGWDPASASPPTVLTVVQSRSGYGVHLDDTLTIPVDDTSFAGNCASGAPLSQAEADFITGRVFADTFTALDYDAATCTTSAR